MKFKKAKQNRLFQDVVEQVENAILAGDIPAGKRLPAERDLCLQFSASRGTVREALRILEQKGLISIKLGAGGGAFVRRRHAELITENFSMLIRSGEVTTANLFQLYETIEVAIAALAAKKVTQGTIAVLKRLVLKGQARMDDGPDGWPDFLETDREVWETIRHIVDNPLYGFVRQAIRQTLANIQGEEPATGADDVAFLVQNTRMLVYAIGKNDASLAARQARSRVNWLRKRHQNTL